MRGPTSKEKGRGDRGGEGKGEGSGGEKGEEGTKGRNGPPLFGSSLAPEDIQIRIAICGVHMAESLHTGNVFTFHCACVRHL